MRRSLLRTTTRLGPLPLLAIALIALFACALTACGSPPNPALPGGKAGKCDDFEQDVESFWSEESRTEVNAGILQVGGTQTREISYRVVTKMDELTRDWVMMQKGICKDTVEREAMTREVYVKVSLCLRATLSSQRTLVTTLKHATREHVFNVERALADVQEDALACQKEAIYSAYDEKLDDAAAREARDKLAQAQVYRTLEDERAEATVAEAVKAAGRAAATRVKVDALVESARQANDQAEYEKALRLGGEAQLLASSTDYALGIAEALLAQGNAHYELGQYAQAIVGYEAALAIFRAKLGDKNLKVSEVHGNLALAHAAREDLKQFMTSLASMVASAAIGDWQKLSEAERTQALRFLHVFIGILGLIPDPLFMALQEQGLSLAKKVVGEKHPDTAAMYGNVGATYLAMGNYARALESYGSALAILREVVGEDHVLTAETYDRSGDVYRAKREYGQAMANYEGSLAILLRRTGEKNLRTSTVYSHIGHVQVAQGQNEAALRSYEKSLAIQRAILGDESPRVAEVYHDIATVRSIMGDQRTALVEFERALARFRKVSPEDNFRTSTVYFNMALAYSRSGDDARALQEFERSLAVRRKVLGEDNAKTAIAYLYVGREYVKAQKWSPALNNFQKALASYRTVYGDAHRDTEEARQAIEDLCDESNYGDACDSFEDTMLDARVAVPTGMSRLKLASNVEFAPGKSKLKETTDTKRALEEVRAYLIANPRVVKLRIEGHTDNTHDRKASVKLSGERALSIKKYLVNQGIPAQRVLAVGFGPAKPIADNASAEGRAMNNRIEFEVAEIDGPKQGVDPAAGGRVFE